jgi:hypothetical protein
MSDVITEPELEERLRAEVALQSQRFLLGRAAPDVLPLRVDVVAPAASRPAVSLGRAVAQPTLHSPCADDAWRNVKAQAFSVVRSTNWMWALGALAVWAGIFFAFLLIAIARP